MAVLVLRARQRTVPLTTAIGVVYVLTLLPYSWQIGTSSDRVVVGPALFLAALTPLREQASLRTVRGSSPDA